MAYLFCKMAAAKTACLFCTSSVANVADPFVPLHRVQADQGVIVRNWSNQGRTALNASKNTELTKNMERLREYGMQARLRLTLSSIICRIVGHNLP